MRRSRSEGKRRGFTLIELVLTFVLVGLTAIPLSLTVVAQMEALRESADLTAAADLGRLEMERVRMLDFDRIVSAVFPRYGGGGYDVVRTVSYLYGGRRSAEALKKVRVEVRPTGKTRTLAVFITYYAKNAGYGA